MSPKTRTLLLITAIIVALLLVFFPAQVDEAEDGVQDSTVRVGWIGPMSGPASIIGIDSQKAVYLALSKIRAEHPGLSFEYYFEDDQYFHKNSIIKYEKLVKQNQVDLLILATYSALKKISEMALSDGVILINSIDNDKNLVANSGNTFLIAKKTENLANLIVRQLSKLGKKRTMILHYSDDDFMPLLSESVEAQIRAASLLSINKTYSRRITNFRPIIKSVAQFSPDSFVLLGYENIGIAIRQLREAGYSDAPVFTANLGNPVREIAGEYINGIYYTDFTELDGSPGKIKEFIEQFQSEFNKRPDLLWTATQTYDALDIALPLFFDASGRKLPVDSVTERLFKVKNFDGVSGSISILPNGSSTGLGWSLYRWKNGQPNRVTGAELPDVSG